MKFTGGKSELNIRLYKSVNSIIYECVEYIGYEFVANIAVA